jgi:hypothetical protein
METPPAVAVAAKEERKTYHKKGSVLKLEKFHALHF